jgi:hypothetical protein
MEQLAAKLEAQQPKRRKRKKKQATAEPAAGQLTVSKFF